MIFVLLAALAVGVACYFGIDALGTAAIDRWYLSDDAIAARNLEHARSCSASARPSCAAGALTSTSCC